MLEVLSEAQLRNNEEFKNPYPKSNWIHSAKQVRLKKLLRNTYLVGKHQV